MILHNYQLSNYFLYRQLATGIMEALSGDRILPDSQACLDYVQANYNWHKIAQQIKLVYQSALHKE